MDTSPRVITLAWGRIEVDGLGVFKDAKLWPGGGREWDWNETGTRHRPGIQPTDVAELVDHGAEVIVLGRGMEGALGVCPETIAGLRSAGIRVEVEHTRRAVEVYNDLCAGTPAGGLFHSTC